MRQHFLAGIKPSDYHSLEQLREDLIAYVQKYNQTVHSSIGMTPQDRFFQESEKIIRMDPDEIDMAFLLEEVRKVSNDSVIVLQGKNYEVNSLYRGLKLKIRYSPDLRKVFIIDDETGEVTPLKLLDKHANATAKRRKVKFTEEK